MASTYENIIKIPLGHVSCFAIKAKDGYLLVDTGTPGNYEAIAAKMKEAGADIPDIKYIFITHHHIDHVGSLSAIREKTGASLVLHKKAVPYLEKGISVVGKPANFIAGIMHAIISLISPKNYDPIKTGENDIIIDGDDDTSLREAGIDGKILYTPGHTDDSMCILLDDGTLIGGDAINPLFIDNKDDLERTIQKIKDSGAKQILPSHGNMFDVEKIGKK